MPNRGSEASKSRAGAVHRSTFPVLKGHAGSATGALFQGPGGWFLAPQGAAVHLLEQTAVIADVHLGYEWARGTQGDCLPAHSLDETVTKLAALLAGLRLQRLVIAGDLVESPRPCRRTRDDLRSLSRWLEERGVDMTVLAGNHDPPQVPPLAESWTLDGWTIAHGHRPLLASRTITGHIHPVLRSGSLTAPCFLVGERTIVLPAFSRNAAGGNVTAIAKPLFARDSTLRCIASTGEELLDFGPLPALASRLGAC